MSVWDEVVGQPEAVETLQRAVADPAAMTHAWLFTGPPGSGRSVAARAFAAALLCPTGGCGVCRECETARAGTHADVTVVNTEGLSIKVEEARDLVTLAAMRPSVGRYRVIVIEDADRLTERAADALLKALEEPVPGTVWMLCAPSVEDVVITVLSHSSSAVMALMRGWPRMPPALPRRTSGWRGAWLEMSSRGFDATTPSPWPPGCPVSAMPWEPLRT